MSDTKHTNDEAARLQTKLDKENIDGNNGIHRSNSVSKMALHFKSLQDKANAKEKDGLPQRIQSKGSRGIQRYRERKNQGNDRFSTQPVTLQEVQEAVLHNQRNATTARRSSLVGNSSDAVDDEFDPSKLSLAERVRLFNQKIDTEKTSKNTVSERHSRRRPAARYKTQPVTSEEVEVASRISTLSTVNQSSSNTGTLAFFFANILNTSYLKTIHLKVL